MSKWSSEAASRYKQQQKVKQLDNAATLHRQRIIDESAPRIFAELCDTFEEECAAFNAEPDMHGTLIVTRSPTALQIENAHGHRIIKIESSNLFSGNVTLSGMSIPSRNVDLETTTDGTKAYLTDPSGRVVEINSVVRIALEDLLGTG
jgi:hypothetical protein